MSKKVATATNVANEEARKQAASVALKAGIKALRGAGVASFALGISDGNAIVTHVEAMTNRFTSQISISLFNQVLDREINAPGVSPEMIKAFQELGMKFQLLLREHNARVDAIAAHRE